MASNYFVDKEGSTFIAATQRPDGTWRKPRKVKEGYVPQDEVPLYESKGKIFEKSQPKYPVGLSEEYVREAQERRAAELKKQNQSIPGLLVPTSTKKKKKKKPSGESKPPPAEELLTTTSYNSSQATRMKADEWTTVVGKSKVVTSEKKEQKKLPSEVKLTKSVEKIQVVQSVVSSVVEAVDPAKRVKNLRKRLKQIHEIEEKKASGAKLDKDQLEKMSRKKELEEEISRLMQEFNLSS